MGGLIIVVGLLILAVLTPRYGMDERDGRDWSDGYGRDLPRPRRAVTPASDLRLLLAAARRVTGRIRGGPERRPARRSRPRTVGGHA
jgi:hypothetical protein